MHVSQVLNRYLLHALTLLELLIPHSFDRCLTISECILTLIIWEFFRHYFLIHSNLDIHIFLAISMLCIPKHVLPKYGIYSLKNSVFSLPFNPSKFGYTCIFGYTNVMYPEKRSTKVRYTFSEALRIFTPTSAVPSCSTDISNSLHWLPLSEQVHPHSQQCGSVLYVISRGIWRNAVRYVSNSSYTQCCQP